jgi:hypothetical protein
MLKLPRFVAESLNKTRHVYWPQDKQDIKTRTIKAMHLKHSISGVSENSKQLKPGFLSTT